MSIQVVVVEVVKERLSFKQNEVLYSEQNHTKSEEEEKEQKKQRKKEKRERERERERKKREREREKNDNIYHRKTKNCTLGQRRRSALQ